MNCEKFATEDSIPFELGSDISKVRQLNGFSNFGVDNNSSKADSILHKFHFYSVSSAEDIEELFLFLIFDDFIVNSSLEIIDSGGWLESEVNVLLLSGIYCDRVARLHRDKLLLQLFQLVVHIEGNLNFLL